MRYPVLYRHMVDFLVMINENPGFIDDITDAAEHVGDLIELVRDIVADQEEKETSP